MRAYMKVLLISFINHFHMRVLIGFARRAKRFPRFAFDTTTWKVSQGNYIFAPVLRNVLYSICMPRIH